MRWLKGSAIFGPLVVILIFAVRPHTPETGANAIPLRPDLSPSDRLTVTPGLTNRTLALAVYADLTGRQLLPRTNRPIDRLDDLLHRQLSRWRFVKRAPAADIGISYHGDGSLTVSELKSSLEAFFATNGLRVVPVGSRYLQDVSDSSP